LRNVVYLKMASTEFSAPSDKGMVWVGAVKKLFQNLYMAGVGKVVTAYKKQCDKFLA